MDGNITKTALVSSAEELLRAICAPNVLPDENADDYNYLRHALFEYLDPKSPYEHLLAEQMVALEWDAVRYRRLRDNLLKAEFRAFSEGALALKKIGPVNLYIKDKNYKLQAQDLVGQDSDRRKSALAILAENEITTSEIMAKAYQSIAKDVAVFERQIVETETRRRKMREDFDRVRASRAKPIEDAQVIEP